MEKVVSIQKILEGDEEHISRVREISCIQMNEHSDTVLCGVGGGIFAHYGSTN